MAGNDLTNIQIYQKKRHINIGVILFGVIFIYLIITILAYVTSRRVSVYEVREGSILKDTAYTGIVLRQEEIVTANTEGYINYFVTEGSKVGKKSNVYSISKDRLDLDSAGTEEENTDEQTDKELTAEEQASIIQKAQSFTDSYRPEQYSDIYTFKSTVTDVVQTNSAQSRQAKLDALLQSGMTDLSVYPAQDDGIIIYSIDGYENLTLDQVTEDIIAKTDYEITELTDNTLVSSGDPIYKLITSDEWTLVIELDDNMAKELADKTSIKVRFTKDGETTWASFALYNTKESNLGFFTFDHSMIRYATERFLDIELILEDESGLKIPKSSVTKKDFYIVPQDYLTKGGNSNDTGVLVQGRKDTAEFETATVYYRDI
ncbi:MAG: HlyD family efflux transporter periplasmic adaptor subunit, partial [Eubacteriales bacterium]|nr:HlyD family efflux transporter periplasmic adaptor subunit [Eubacteriales bacterium]